MHLVHPRRFACFAVVLGLIATAVAGCGKAEFTYVANQDEKVYFKVPSDWQQVPADDAVDAFFGIQSGSATAGVVHSQRWTAVYDAGAAPSATHLFTYNPTPQPIVFSMVKHLSEGEQSIVSYDQLRDYFLPVTQTFRDQVEQVYTQQVQQAVASGFAATDVPAPLGGFELLYDQVLAPAEGLSGVRVVYNYLMPLGGVHTFDYTALVNNDKSIAYFLLMRCTSTCYDEQQSQLNDIATSFTVRSDL